MNIETDLGLNLKLMFAGLAGGVVNALVFWQGFPQAIASVIAGVFMANYGAPLVAHWLDLPEPVAGFLCGMSALVLTDVLIRFVVKKIGGFSNGNGNVSNAARAGARDGSARVRDSASGDTEVRSEQSDDPIKNPAGALRSADRSVGT
jgi:hypothetical protein